MPSETESSYLEPLSEWGEMFAKFAAIGRERAKVEPRMETVHRKVSARPAPVPPAPKKPRGRSRPNKFRYQRREHDDEQ